MDNDDVYQIDKIYQIAIAGFLHDIGKFAQRANMPDGIDQIEKFLPEKLRKENWKLDDSLTDLAAEHYKPGKPLQWIIAIADRVSSGFSEEDFEDYHKAVEGKNNHSAHLFTIFERLDPQGKSEPEAKCAGDNPESCRFRYPLKELSPKYDSILPIDTNESKLLDSEQASAEYEKLFSAFKESLDKSIYRNNLPLWFEHFDSLFMIFASNIPAATVDPKNPVSKIAAIPGEAEIMQI